MDASIAFLASSPPQPDTSDRAARPDDNGSRTDDSMKRLSQVTPHHDLRSFSLKDMSQCTAALRKCGRDATTMEEAAGRIVRYLYDHLADPQSGERHCLLVRLFKTHPYDQLPASLQQFALGRIGQPVAPPGLKCFTLLASAGLETTWNDRRTSARYQAIPMVEAGFSSQFPMIAHMMSQFGVEFSAVLRSSPDLVRVEMARTYNVFYVPEAEGSPHMPIQQDFVRRYGVKSVLGGGAMLPCGNLYAMLLFTSVSMPPDTADSFKALALAAKVALLPFHETQAFTETSRTRE